MIPIVFLCLGMCLGAVVTVISLERFKATLLKKRIQELENEMMCSHAEILRLEKEIATISFSDSFRNTA